MCSMNVARLAGGGRGKIDACCAWCHCLESVRTGGQLVIRLAGTGVTFQRAWRPRH